MSGHDATRPNKILVGNSATPPSHRHHLSSPFPFTKFPFELPCKSKSFILFPLKLTASSAALDRLSPIANNNTMAQTTTLKKFESIFPRLVEDLLDHARSYKLPQEFVSWYKAVSTVFLSLEHTS